METANAALFRARHSESARVKDSYAEVLHTLVRRESVDGSRAPFFVRAALFKRARDEIDAL